MITNHEMNRAITAAMADGEFQAPQQLLQHLASLADPIVALYDWTVEEAVDKTLLNQFPFLGVVHSNFALHDEEYFALVRLLRWLHRSLESHTEHPPAKTEVVAYLLVASYLGNGRTLWRELPWDSARGTGVAQELASILGGLHYAATPLAGPIPIWERETLEQLREADAQKDFPTIADILPHFESAASNERPITPSRALLSLYGVSPPGLCK